MLCLSDSDLIIKLAEFDLLEQSLRALGVTRSDVRVLSELRFVLTEEKLFLKHSRTGIQRALNFVKGIKIVEKVDRQEHILLQGVYATYRKKPIRINGGEAVLFSATKYLQDYVIATGDKRSLRALASAGNCAHIHARLKGRVVSLEQILLRLIDAHGHGFVRHHVGPSCDCDVCLQHAFGNPALSEKDCRHWLNCYVEELRTESAGLLIA